MNRLEKIIRSFFLFTAIGPFVWLSVVLAANTGPGTEQQRMQTIEESRRSAKRVEAPPAEAAISVSEVNVADEKIAAAAAQAQEGPVADGGTYTPVSGLSDAAENVTVVIGSIQVPDDAPISKSEMEMLVQSFEGKETKLSQIIYLTENISQLYASAESVTNLTTLREGFNDEDNRRNTSPTMFKLTKVNVPDDAAVSKDEVEALVKPYEGKDLTLGELRAFAKNVDKIYLSAENISAIAEGAYQPVFGPASSSRKASWKAAKAAAAKADAGLPTEDVPFLIKKIEVTGNTVMAEDEVRKITAPYEGKQMKLAEAKAVAAELTKLYRTKGFVTCRAYIPPQKMSEGTLKIQVLEGKLGMVKVQGNKFFGKDLIKRFVNQSKGKVLEYSELSKNVVRANMHPDREVKAVIVPGKVVGTSDLILDVKDEFPLHIGGEMNNFGTKLTGKERYNVSMRHTNVTQHDDILAARLQFGDEVFAVGTQYLIPFGQYDTQIGGTFNYTDVSIGKDFAVLDLGGKAYAYSIFLNQPVGSAEWNVFNNPMNMDFTWTGSFESKSIDNTMLGESSSHDDLRMLHTGVNIDEKDQFGRTFIVNDFVFGLTWLGASEKHDPALSRPDAGSGFFKYVNSVNRVHPVYDSTYLLLKTAGQYSSDRFVSAEQFDIGGVYSVRGYPQSDYLGDYGMSGSAELRIPLYFIPRDVKAPWSQEPLWNKINMVGFLDGAHAVLRNPAVGEYASRNYFGMGGGIRFDLPKNLTGRFEWAAPMDDDPTDGSNGQFYFSVSGEI